MIILSSRYHYLRTALAVFALSAIIVPSGVRAQEPRSAEPIPLTVEEAIQIALLKSYVMRTERLSVDEASSLIREGWGQLVPQVSLSSGYTRNIRSANPFSGSDAGSFFGSFGLIDWLAFNEGARIDDSGETTPITLEEFFSRQQAGLAAAGVAPADSDNPFAIPNQFQANISVQQKIFDIRTFWGVSGATKYLRSLNEAGVSRQEQLLTRDVRTAYFGSLLAQEQARVVAQSVSRTRATRDEVALRVVRGLMPKYQRLTAEVQLTNLETDLIQARNQVENAVGQLKLLLGIPVENDVVLKDDLALDPSDRLMGIAPENAVSFALENRPDLEQARINLELERIQLKVARADYYPTIEAVANFGYIGNVPDARTSVLGTDPADPFSFQRIERGFFDDGYWDFVFSAGLSLNWTLFDGLQTHQRTQQRRISEQRARIAHDQLAESIRLEVEEAMRNLEAARLRIESQVKNVETAELNYDFARSRLREGVASQLEERDSSELLDQSLFNYLQAVYDFVVAKSAFDAALGITPQKGGTEQKSTAS